MGTDVFEREQPCLCERGRIVITTTSPDHGWVSAYNVHRSARIDCSECAKAFLVDDMRIVRRSDYARWQEARHKLAQAQKELTESETFRGAQAQFAQLLDSLPSVAAVYRYLSAERLESYAIGTFRKYWRGGADWARQYVGVWNLRRVLGLLGKDVDAFVPALKRIDELEAAVPRVPTVRRL